MFKTAKIAELTNENSTRIEDANRQKDIAKTDFLRMISSTLEKVHKLNNLDETDKNTLKTKVIEARTDFVGEVMTWAVSVDQALSTVLDNMSADFWKECERLETTVETAPGCDPGNSLINQLQCMKDEDREHIDDVVAKQNTLALAQVEEIGIWLEGHNTQLSEALATVLSQEHSYNYVPEGYTYDPSKYALTAFQNLNDKFQEIVVQMTGTYDTWLDGINEAIDEKKETNKETIELKVTAAERSLTMATNAFGEGIKLVRESIEMKAQTDMDNIQAASTDARKLLAHQLETEKDKLWREISFLAKKLYADERKEYEIKLKGQILEKFTEFRDAIVEYSLLLQKDQKDKWNQYQAAITEYYTFYDKKVLGAKEALFNVSQKVLWKALLQIINEARDTVGAQFDTHEHKVFKQLHVNRNNITNLYNNAVKSIDNIDDKKLTTPLVEMLNGHKEEADYEFDSREDDFLDRFIVIREWWRNFLEDEAERFRRHIGAEEARCEEQVHDENHLLKQWIEKSKKDMVLFYGQENQEFKDFVDGCVDKFKWLLRKYGMLSELPQEDMLYTISQDPFTGHLNDEDTEKLKADVASGAVEVDNVKHSVPYPYPEQRVLKDDPLETLPGKPNIPHNEGLKPPSLLAKGSRGTVPTNE